MATELPDYIFGKKSYPQLNTNFQPETFSQAIAPPLTSQIYPDFGVPDFGADTNLGSKNISDYNQPQAPQIQQPDPYAMWQSQFMDLMKGYNDTSEDESKAKRQQKLARVNALGDAMRNIADAIYAPQGAMIAQHDHRQTLASLEKYQQMLDNIDAKKERGKAMELNMKIKALDMFYKKQEDEMNWNRSIAAKDKDWERTTNFEKAMLEDKQAFEAGKFDAEWINRGNENAARIKSDKEIAGLRAGTDRYIADLNSEAKAAALEAKLAGNVAIRKGVYFEDPNGNQLKVRTDHFDKLFNQIMDDYEQNPSVFPSDMGMMTGGMSRSEMDKDMQDNIVKRFGNVYIKDNGYGYAVPNFGEQQPSSDAATTQTSDDEQKYRSGIAIMSGKDKENAIAAFEEHFKKPYQEQAVSTPIQTPPQKSAFGLNDYQVNAVTGFDKNGNPIIDQKVADTLRVDDKNANIQKLTKEIERIEKIIGEKTITFKSVRAEKDKKNILSQIEELQQRLSESRQQLNSLK